MSHPARFWDKHAAGYAKSKIKDEAAYEHKLHISQQYFHKDMQVVELGCGTGSTAIRHAPYVDRLLAVDISPKMLEIAQAKADAADIVNIDFLCSPIDDINLTDNSVDAVLALSVLHLLEDKEAAIAKVFRALKPGGLFISSTVCLADGMRWVGLIAPIGKLLGFFPLVNIFSKDHLEAALKQAGFDIDYRWHSDKNKAVAFLVAKKPMSSLPA